MIGSTEISLSGSIQTDMLMSGLRWNTTTLTYGFPTGGSSWSSVYETGSEPYTDFASLPAEEQEAVRTVLTSWAKVANLSFIEVSEPSTTAEMRFAMTSQSSTAHAYYPSNSAQGGDTWFGPNFVNQVWTPGNYEYLTTLHEVGHALGLKHPHEDADNANGGYAANPAIDSIEVSVMSYRSYPSDDIDAGNGYQLATGSYPAGPMVNDIAAIQYLYGANYATNAGNTVYSFSPGTATIFETVWDGGGIDTYDLSAYTVSVSVSLIPGQWSTFSSDQLANLNSADASVVARGNVANAYLYNNDARSLIENATTGSGNDAIVGNDGDNVVFGGVGSDTAWGGNGNDQLYGNFDSDMLYGEAGDDILFGGQGGDVVFGSVGADQLYGNMMNDVVYGEAGDDSIFGGQGNDQLFGGQGNDFIAGNLGDDTMTGGAGADRFVFNGNDVVADFNAAEGDRMALSAGVTYAVGAGSGGALVTFSTGATVTLTGFSATQVTADWFSA
ncbi:MAG TPA: M10 family metallopeptidase [Azospirillum sp.]